MCCWRRPRRSSTRRWFSIVCRDIARQKSGGGTGSGYRYSLRRRAPVSCASGPGSASGDGPVPVSLSPLSKEMLEDFLLAEMPPLKQMNADQQKVMEPIIQAHGDKVHPVGLIYARLYWLFQRTTSPRWTRSELSEVPFYLLTHSRLRPKSLATAQATITPCCLSRVSSQLQPRPFNPERITVKHGRSRHRAVRLGKDLSSSQLPRELRDRQWVEGQHTQPDLET